MKIPCLDDAENYESSGQIETVPEDQLRFAVGVIMAQSKFYNFKQCRGHGKFKNYG